jgi:hypothetical protein
VINCVYSPAIGVRRKERINGTRMTLVTRIVADKTQKISVNPRYQRHPRSIESVP